MHGGCRAGCVRRGTELPPRGTGTVEGGARQGAVDRDDVWRKREPGRDNGKKKEEEETLFPVFCAQNAYCKCIFIFYFSV